MLKIWLSLWACDMVGHTSYYQSYWIQTLEFRGHRNVVIWNSAPLPWQHCNIITIKSCLNSLLVYRGTFMVNGRFFRYREEEWYGILTNNLIWYYKLAVKAICLIMLWYVQVVSNILWYYAEWVPAEPT